MAVQPWFPLALAASIASGAFLWWALTDRQRARYYPIIVSLPVTVFFAARVLGATPTPPT